jgi:hypothetical protein
MNTNVWSYDAAWRRVRGVLSAAVLALAVSACSASTVDEPRGIGPGIDDLKQSPCWRSSSAQSPCQLLRVYDRVAQALSRPGRP